jgi:hypothetical protein
MTHCPVSHPLRCGLLACSLTLTPALADSLEPSSASGQQTVVVEPGEIHEVCARLTPPQRLHYSFDASSELAFNIHYHADHRVAYPVPEHPASQADAIFVPDSGQHYCLMWSNPGNSAVELRLEQITLQP